MGSLDSLLLSHPYSLCTYQFQPLYPSFNMAHTILVFFLTNYVSHAATVPSWPGVSTRRDLEWAVIALLLPYAGIANSCHMIIHYIFHHGDDVGRAIGGKALLVVARKEGWQLQPGERVYVERDMTHSQRTIRLVFTFS